jgi:hypothetical protein
MEKYIVTLEPEEREQLEALVSKGKHAAQKVLTALVLLNCDTSKQRERRRSSEELAEVLQISARKIDRVKRCFVEEGLEAVFNRQPSHRVYEHIVDGDAEAHLIALSCSEPPKGRARWSLRLLAEKAVELQYVETISHETVRRVLKKTNSSPGKKWAG